MIHLKTTQRSFRQACDALPLACQSQGYGVLAQHNVGDTLRSKGIDYSGQCIVFEICQPSHAAAILKADPSLASGLPCRIAVSQQGNEPVSVSMFSAEQLLREASSDVAIQRVGSQVELETLQIMEMVAH